MGNRKNNVYRAEKETRNPNFQLEQLEKRVFLSAVLPDTQAIPSISPVVSVTATDNTASETALGQNADTATFRISRSTATSAPVTIQFALAGSAKYGVDYNLNGNGLSAMGNSITIAGGQDHADITVSPKDDFICEPTETITLAIMPNSAYNLSPDASLFTSTVTIADNEPVITISAIDNQASEKAVGDVTNPAVFRITRTGSTANPVTIYFSRAGSAVYGSLGDYTLSGSGLSTTGTSVTLASGQDHADITVNPVDNFICETPETVSLTITAKPYYYVPADVSERTSIITIADNEPLVTIEAIDGQAAETTPGQNADTAAFRISRIGDTFSPLTVYFTRSGTAKYGETGDYSLSGDGLSATTNSITIAAGKDHADIIVNAIDDSLAEMNESISLTLSPRASYYLIARTAETWITDNEPAVVIESLDSQAFETTSGEAINGATFRISRIGNMFGPLTVYFTRTGTAKYGVDYTLSGSGLSSTANSITLASGQDHADITLNAVDDFLCEPAENVILTLTAKTTYNIFERAATVSIADNEPTVSLTAIDSQAGETINSQSSDTGCFRISRTGSTNNPLTVFFTRSGKAVYGASGDYVLNGSGLSAAGTSVVIPSGQDHTDIMVSTINNLIYKANMTVGLTLTAKNYYYLSSDATKLSSAITITDNDVTGLWTGTWGDGGWYEALSLNLKADNTLTGTFQQPLDAYGYSGTTNISLHGTYSYDSINDKLNFQSEGITTIHGYSVKYVIDGSGTSDAANATGSCSISFYLFYDGDWHLQDSDDGTLWAITHV